MIFGRSGQTDSKLSTIMEGVGWSVMIFNTLTLYPYFMKVLGRTAWWQQIFGSGVGVMIILGVEFAALSVLCNSNVLLSAVERPRSLLNSADPIVKNISGVASVVGIIGFCLLASYVFWFDYKINLSQMVGSTGVSGTSQFLQILAAIFVLGSEIAFGCQNVFQLSGTTENKNSDSRRNA